MPGAQATGPGIMCRSCRAHLSVEPGQRELTGGAAPLIRQGLEILYELDVLQTAKARSELEVGLEVRQLRSASQPLLLTSSVLNMYAAAVHPLARGTTNQVDTP